MPILFIFEFAIVIGNRNATMSYFQKKIEVPSRPSTKFNKSQYNQWGMSYGNFEEPFIYLFSYKCRGLEFILPVTDIFSPFIKVR